MTEKLKKVITTVLLFVLYIIFEYFIILILKTLNFDITNLDNITQNIIRTLISLLLMFLFFLIYRKSLVDNFKDFKDNGKSYFKFGIKYWLIGLVIMIASNLVIGNFVNTPTNEVMVQNSILANPIYTFINAVLVAPFIEELIFRKSIKDFLNNSYLYVLISGLSFGYIHLISGGQNELIYIIPYGIMGCIFAYLYKKTNNIFTPITFHVIHNLISVSTYLITLF